MPVELKEILTPELYKKVLEYSFPWEVPVDMKFASKFLMSGEPDITKNMYTETYHNALKPISTLAPTIPRVTPYLPPKTAREYPEHVLALMLLLDQAPRMLFTGMSYRYTNSFFDFITQKYLRELMTTGALPDSIDQWTGLGYPFEDAMCRRWWFNAPLAHSEDLELHHIAREKTEEMRVAVEKYSGKRDPARDTREEDAKDTLLFSRLITGGPPPETFAEFFFWLFRVFDAHTPIIETFGRYPYRNDSLGRESTTREKEWLKQTEYFGAPDLTEAQVRRLRELVKSGKWVELRDEDVKTGES